MDDKNTKNRRLMDTITLSKINTARLRDMLTSKLSEDLTVGFSLMEELDLTENIATILCVLKDTGHTNFNRVIFEENFPKILPYFTKEKILKNKYNSYINSHEFTYELMLNIVKKVNSTKLPEIKSHIENVFMEHFSNMGINFIEDINLKLSDEYSNI